MMPDTEYLQTIFSQARTGADFPRVATELISAGIRGFSYHVASGDIRCFDDEGEALSLSGSAALLRPVARNRNLAHLSAALRAHQSGRSDFAAFCQQAADAGVNLWVADLNRMTVSYFTYGGYLIREESIPEIRTPLKSNTGKV